MSTLTIFWAICCDLIYKKVHTNGLNAKMTFDFQVWLYLPWLNSNKVNKYDDK